MYLGYIPSFLLPHIHLVVCKICKYVGFRYITSEIRKSVSDMYFAEKMENVCGDDSYYCEEKENNSKYSSLPCKLA